MTLLASWVGIDSRAPASIYVVSDSRITWGDSARFDFGRKVFGCKNYPDIFGYCGDVLFPSIVLGQIVDLIDSGLLFKENWSCEQKSQAVMKRLIESFNQYPIQVEGIATDSIEIIHCCRDSNSLFYCQKMKWSKTSNTWRCSNMNFEKYSDKLFVLGSGSSEFLKKYDLYWKSSNQKTSRALFHCFCDTLSDIKDTYCGGAPQLVGLYRIGNARHYGIIYDGKRYFDGIRINNLPKDNFANIEWRNELFERCEGRSMQIMEKAQRQPNPVKKS